MKMEQTECSETSAYKIQTPGNSPVENIQHTEHGESLKSRIQNTYLKERSSIITTRRTVTFLETRYHNHFFPMCWKAIPQ